MFFFVSVTISIRILPLHPKYTDQTPSLGLPYLRRPEEKIGRKASVNEIVKQKRVRLEKREVQECSYLWDVTRSFESGRREPPTGNFYPIAFPCEFDYMWSSRFFFISLFIKLTVDFILIQSNVFSKLKYRSPTCNNRSVSMVLSSLSLKESRNIEATNLVHQVPFTLLPASLLL